MDNSPAGSHEPDEVREQILTCCELRVTENLDRYACDLWSCAPVVIVGKLDLKLIAVAMLGRLWKGQLR